MLKALAQVLTLLLAVLVALLPLPALPVEASEAEGATTMAAPAVFLLEQPPRQALASFTNRKALALYTLLVALLVLEGPRLGSLRQGQYPAPQPRPKLYALGKLQLEGG